MKRDRIAAAPGREPAPQAPPGASGRPPAGPEGPLRTAAGPGPLRTAAGPEGPASLLARLKLTAAALSAPLSPAQAADAIFRLGLAHAGARRAVFYQIARSGALEQVHQVGLDVETARRFRRLDPSAPVPAGEVVRDRRPIWLAGPAAIAARYPQLEEMRRAAGDQAWAALALTVAGRPIGALAAAFGTALGFSEDERVFFEGLADLAAQAFERSRLLAAQKELRARAEESAAALETFLANTPSGLALLDRRLRFVTVNAALAALSGTSAEDHVGRRVKDVLPEVSQWAGKALRHVLQTLEPIASAGVSAEIPAGSGRVRHWLASFFPVWTLAEGLAGVGWVMTEVTRLRQAELERERLVRELRQALAERDESMAQLDSLLAAVPIGIAFLNRDLRYARVNPALAEMSGRPAEEHLGRTAGELQPGHPAGAAGGGGPLAEVLETGRPVLDLELAGPPDSGGERRTWLESYYPVQIGGRTIGLGAVAREVTAERRIEEFRRHLLAIVGHDLRDPLAAIASSTDLLLRGEPLPPRQTRALERTRRCAQTMERIIRTLQDYTLAGSRAAMALQLESIALRLIWDGVVAEARELNPGRRIDYRPRGDGTGRWDRQRIEQVLANLLAGALQYGPPGEPIQVAWTSGARCVVLRVVHGGPPIPPDQLPFVFAPQRRPAEPAGLHRGGLGLGLFVTHHIVQAHGGAIQVESDAEKGTIFTVRLPRGDTAEA